MAEKTKYDLFVEELNSLEKDICALIQKNEELSATNKVLNLDKERLTKENEVLKLKLEELENNSDNDSGNYNGKGAAVAVKDKELILKQIDEIVKVIDVHLSS